MRRVLWEGRTTECDAGWWFASILHDEGLCCTNGSKNTEGEHPDGGGRLIADQIAVIKVESKTEVGSIMVYVLILSTITGKLPLRRCHPDEKLSGVRIALAEPRFYEPAPVDLLLGADVFYRVLNSGSTQIGGLQFQNTMDLRTPFAVMSNKMPGETRPAGM